MGDMTSNDDTSHYEGALLEDVHDQIRLLAEAMSDVPADVRKLQQDVSQIKEDVTFVKHAVTELSSDVNNHEARLKKLEQVHT
jgi:peptidoglycan hydrolase CwlO-like protein